MLVLFGEIAFWCMCFDVYILNSDKEEVYENNQMSETRIYTYTTNTYSQKFNCTLQLKSCQYMLAYFKNKVLCYYRYFLLSLLVEVYNRAKCVEIS